MLADGLTIGGGVLEAIGLGMVFIELAFTRSRELGQPLPWKQVLPWLQRTFWLPRKRDIAVPGIASAESVGSARAIVRPAPIPSGTTNERLARLEQYVEQIDRDLNEVNDAIGRKVEEVLAAAKEHADQIRLDAQASEQERLEALVPSLRRQALGAVLVLCGLTFQTLGGVL